MLHVAVVEDETEYRGLIQEMVGRYAKEYDLQIQTTAFPDGRELVQNYQKFDILLMDIEMPHLNGMEAAQKIRGLDKEVVIVFITNMAQYAIKGYLVDALDYVLKPVSYFAFSQRIDRALVRMKKRDRKYLTIAVKGGMQKIDISQIYYVEVQDHDLIYYTAAGKFRSKGTMNEVEDAVHSNTFFRCNRCYLVNLEHVENFQNGIATVGGVPVLVSRSRKKAFLDVLNDYMNEVGK
mgnify:CR=1 FL=1